MAEDTIIVVPQAEPVTGEDEEIQWLINRLDANDAIALQRQTVLVETLTRLEALVMDRLLSTLESQQRSIVELQAQLTTMATAAIVSSTPEPVIVTEPIPIPEPEPVADVVPINEAEPEVEKKIRKRRAL